MGQSCTVFPYIEKEDGKIEKSKLFDELIEFTNDRDIAKDIYADSKDLKLLNKHLADLEYDELGELTLLSALQVTEIEVEKEKLLRHVNKKYSHKNLPYNEAVLKLLHFNNHTSEYNKNYLATLALNGSNKYDVVIVPKTLFAIESLYELVLNSSLQNRIIYRLAEAGVSVEFLEDAPYNGRYSTKNAIKTSEGFYALIKILKGESIDKTLAEETGHFLLGALKDNPLVKRLEALMTDAVQKEILGDDYSDKVLGHNPAREAAGKLIGDALIGNEEKISNSNIKNLVDRIIQFAKRVFAKITKNTVALDIMEAKEIASSIAEDFMYKEFTGTVEDALETEETLFDKKLSEVDRLLNNITLKVKKLRDTVDLLNKKLSKEIHNIYEFAELARHINMEILDDNFKFQSIIALLSKLQHLCEYDINTDLSKIQPKEGQVRNIIQNSHKLREVREYVNTFISVINLIEDSISNNSIAFTDADFTLTITNIKGERSDINIKEILKKSKDLVSDLVVSLQEKENINFLNFITQIYGENYVNTTKRVVLTGKHLRGENVIDPELLKDKGIIKRFLMTHLKRVKELKIPLKDYLKYLERDNTILDSWGWSNGKNMDIICNIAFKSIKDSKNFSQRMTLSDVLNIILIEREYKKLLKEGKVSNMKNYFERYSDTGDFTSNYISERHWGDWQKEYNDWKKEKKDEYLKAYPESELLDDFTKAAEFEAWFKPLHKLWHKLHSEWIPDPRDPENTILAPNITSGNGKYTYINKEYNLLTNDDKILLDKIKALKWNMDTKISNVGTFFNRAPLFKGSFINIVKNNMQDFSLVKATGKAFYTKIHDTFCESCTDDEFGCDFTYNSYSDMMYKNALQYQSDLINRLLVYGVRALPNPKEMSTDIFGSLVAYSNMVNNYFASEQIIHSLEVGKEVLARRKGQDSLTELEKKYIPKSRAFNSYCKMLDNKVYKNNSNGDKKELKIMVRKTERFLSTLGSTTYLGGNIPGAIVNIGTGTFEMFKEAVCGEHFTTKLFRKGILEYYKNALVPSMLQLGKQIKENKLDLFIHHFDVLSENDLDFKSKHSTNYSISKIIMGTLFLPYKLGEHFMQCVPYISMALGTDLYEIITDDNGNITTKKTNLWDAYKMNDSKTGLSLEGKYLKDKNTLDLYKFLSSLYKKVSLVESNSNDSKLTLQEKDFISANKVEPANIIHFVQEELSKLLWDSKEGSRDESDFTNKCRDITNKMHGVYNFLDKNNLQHTIIGEMLFAMRGYAIGMAQRRFLGDKFNVYTKKNESGNLTTSVILLLDGLLSVDNFKTSTLAFLAPIVAPKLVLDRMMAAGYGEELYRNMRRTHMDIVVSLVLLLLKILTAKPEGDDQDDLEWFSWSWWAGVSHYLSSRWLRELLAFNSIKGIRDEISTFGNFDPIAVSITGDLISLTRGLIGEQFVTPYSKKMKPENLPKNYTKYYYNSLKKGSYTYGQSKARRKLVRLLPYYRTVEVFRNPYNSAAAFDYSKKLKR